MSDDFLNSYQLCPREAVQHFRAERLDADGLLRAIVTHPAWWVPAQSDPAGVARIGIQARENGTRVLEAWSERTLMPDDAQAEAVAIAGFVLFSRVHTYGVHRVTLNHDTPESLFYLSDQFSLLAAWGAVGSVETALVDPELVGDPFGVLHGFNAWHVLVRAGVQQGEAGDIVLAPDAQDRELAAVFTAPDACRHFEKSMQLAGVLDEVTVQTVDGSELFGQLQYAGIDGVVFNPLTPLPVRALRAEALAKILAAPPWRFTSSVH